MTHWCVSKGLPVMVAEAKLGVVELRAQESAEQALHTAHNAPSAFYNERFKYMQTYSVNPTLHVCGAITRLELNYCQRVREASCTLVLATRRYASV